MNKYTLMGLTFLFYQSLINYESQIEREIKRMMRKKNNVSAASVRSVIGFIALILTYVVQIQFYIFS